MHRFEVTAVADAPGVYRAEVDCSSGTYVRTLADDLGHALGGGAHLRNLRRTAIGSFTLDEAHPLDEITVVPPGRGHARLPAVTVDEPTAPPPWARARCSRPTTLGVAGDGPWAVLGPDGSLLAVYERPSRARR